MVDNLILEAKKASEQASSKIKSQLLKTLGTELSQLHHKMPRGERVCHWTTKAFIQSSDEEKMVPGASWCNSRPPNNLEGRKGGSPVGGP